MTCLCQLLPQFLIIINLSMTNATIYYHLAQLKKADLIREHKEKNFIYYELNLSVFEEVMCWFAQFREEQPK